MGMLINSHLYPTVINAFVVCMFKYSQNTNAFYVKDKIITECQTYMIKCS